MQKLRAVADIEALTGRAAALVAAGRVGAARPLLAAARRLAPDSPNVIDLTALLALRANVPATAMADLNRAIEAVPSHSGLRKRRAELRQQAGDLDGAARDAAEAVVLDPGDATAKALLGTLMLELGRTAEAIVCLTAAASADPENIAFAAALAAAHESAGDADTALAILQRSIAAKPGIVAPRNAAILLCVRRRDFRQAVQLAEDTSRAGIADACSFGLLGHALSSLGRHEEAAGAYAEALKLGPQDPYVRHLVAAAGVLPGAARAPVEYLRAVFDGYADRFEPHLFALGYRVPGLMRNVLRQHPQIVAGQRVGPVLDLGCGTGLVGVAIADLPVGPLIGVDAAPRMLARAREKGLYAELHEADVMSMLRGDPPAQIPPLPLWEGVGGRGQPGTNLRLAPSPCPLPQGEGGSFSPPQGCVHPPRLDSAIRLLNDHCTDAPKVGGYPLILAGDVFCYFGALEDLFVAVHAALRPGGWLVCTVEELLPDTDGVIPGDASGRWALHRQGRYGHGAGYLRDTAVTAGFRVVRLDREALRHEANMPVPGLLAVLERPEA